MNQKVGTHLGKGTGKDSYSPLVSPERKSVVDFNLEKHTWGFGCKIINVSFLASKYVVDCSSSNREVINTFQKSKPCNN